MDFTEEIARSNFLSTRLNNGECFNFFRSATDDKNFYPVPVGKNAPSVRAKNFRWSEVVKGNILIELLGRYSKTNLPMLLLDEMSFAVDTIWLLAERKRHLKLTAGEIKLSEISYHAHGNSYDGILLNQVENMALDQQHQLAHLLNKMPSNEKGKFILTATHFNLVETPLQGALCKINFVFPINSSTPLIKAER